MTQALWDENIHDELTFWEAVIRDEAASADGVRKPGHLDASGLREQVVPQVASPMPFRILDVGAGPFTTFGIPMPGTFTEIVPTDALGDYYNSLFDKYNVVDWPRIRAVKGEELSRIFPLESFHWVHIANALDHCENPIKVIEEMVLVCKPGGIVSIISIENVGELENYHGLHQWNIQVEDDDIVLWNKTYKQKLFSSVAGKGGMTWRYVDHGQTGFRIISVEFRKF